MPAPTVKVELGLDVENPNSARLDDPVKGLLDDPTYTLGGVVYYDITDRVTEVSTRRGKSQALDRIDSGSASVTVINNDRLFDPLYTSSPFYGALVPRRQLRISSNEEPVFFGFIDDFDISYDPSGQSRARIDASDGFSYLNKAEIEEYFPDPELPGERIRAVLELPEVSWPEDKKLVEDGVFPLLDNSVEGTNALEYMQLVANSELGTLFIDKSGNLIYQGRDHTATSLDIEIADTAAANVAPFNAINVVYGSEYLYNKIVISNADVIPEEALAEDAPSQLFYGVLTYSSTGLLTEEPTDLQTLADDLLAKYKQPQYRFESVTVLLDQLDSGKQTDLLDAEIGDLINVRFTPSGIPPQIGQVCKIIGISHSWNTVTKSITFSLETVGNIPSYFTLSNPELGKLSSGNRLR
jgi:hypothetical protein